MSLPNVRETVTGTFKLQGRIFSEPAEAALIPGP
jgi:hypothetical protein